MCIRDRVGGVQPQQMARVGALGGVLVADVQVGVAQIDVPGGGHGAGDLGVDALDDDAGAGPVGLVAIGRQPVAVFQGDVFLQAAECRHGGIERAIEPFALEAGLVARARDGLEGVAAFVLVALRGEDIGVAGVDRVVRRQPIDQAVVGRPGVSGVFAGARAAGTGRVVVVAMDLVDAAAQPGDQGQVVGELEAARDVAEMCIRDRQMDDQGMQSIGDVLGSTTGITFTELDNGGRTTYRARGFNITNYKVDGLSIIGGSSFNGGGSGAINMDLYDRVSIVRGANGLMGGTGDPSATVDLVRKRPGRTLGASLTLRTGSWNKKNAVGDINIPLAADGRVRSRLVFSGEDSDGFRDHSSIERQGFLASFAMDVTDRTQAGLGFQYEHSIFHLSLIHI